jgi:uncharacterized protein (TIGR00266 family)
LRLSISCHRVAELNMEHIIEHGPSFAWLKVDLAPGDELQAEAGAMVRKDTGVEFGTYLNANKSAGIFGKIWALLVALLRKLVGGETMFVNRFTAVTGGQVVVAPSMSGHIVHKKLSASDKLFVQTGSYLASTGDVNMSVRFTGLKSLLGGEGLVLLECQGEGDLWVNAYGGVIPIEVNGDFTVDTGHIVAFDGTLDFSVKSVGGMKSLFFSGEGLVCRFHGRGTVYMQSRNLSALVGWLSPLLPG